MNILLVSAERNWGGGEVQLRYLAEGLLRRGHEVSLLVSSAGVPAQRFAGSGIPTVRFPGRGQNPVACWRIRRSLRRRPPDVLHMNDPRALTAAGIASLGLPLARIVSRRAAFPIRSPGRYRRFADRVICVSRQVAAICCRDGLPEARLRVVYDGADPARFENLDRQRGRAGLEAAFDGAGGPILLAAGKLTACKGHHVLLKALTHLQPALPNLRLAIAGTGEEASALAALARDLRLADRVRFLGFRDDVPELMAGADAFVFPSLEEGLGSTVIEAMLARVPVVASRTGGVPELLEAGNGGPLGTLVPAGDATALAEGIRETLDDMGTAARKSEQARLHALRRFTADAMVEDTLAVYRELLGEIEQNQQAG